MIVDDETKVVRLCGATSSRRPSKGVDLSESPEQAAGQVAIGTTRPGHSMDMMLFPRARWMVMKSPPDPRPFSSVPIIMLTAKSRCGTNWSGFDAVADDYVTNHSTPKELVCQGTCAAQAHPGALSCRRLPADVTLGRGCVIEALTAG
jgi:DNA-binding response OmpR family regulator